MGGADLVGRAANRHRAGGAAAAELVVIAGNEGLVVADGADSERVGGRFAVGDGKFDGADAAVGALIGNRVDGGRGVDRSAPGDGFAAACFDEVDVGGG